MPGPGMQTDAEKVFAKFNEELHKIKGFENLTVENSIFKSTIQKGLTKTVSPLF